MSSQADKQPRTYTVNLHIETSEMDDALLAAVATEGGQPVHVLKTAGTFHQHLHAVVVAALTAHLAE